MPKDRMLESNSNCPNAFFSTQLSFVGPFEPKTENKSKCLEPPTAGIHLQSFTPPLALMPRGSATWPPRCHRRRQAAPKPRGTDRPQWLPHGQCQPDLSNTAISTVCELCFTSLKCRLQPEDFHSPKIIRHFIPVGSASQLALPPLPPLLAGSEVPQRSQLLIQPKLMLCRYAC